MPPKDFIIELLKREGAVFGDQVTFVPSDVVDRMISLAERLPYEWPPWLAALDVDSDYYSGVARSETEYAARWRLPLADVRIILTDHLLLPEGLECPEDMPEKPGFE